MHGCAAAAQLRLARFANNDADLKVTGGRKAIRNFGGVAIAHMPANHQRAINMPCKRRQLVAVKARRDGDDDLS